MGGQQRRGTPAHWGSPPTPAGWEASGCRHSLCWVLGGDHCAGKKSMRVGNGLWARRGKSSMWLFPPAPTSRGQILPFPCSYRWRHPGLMDTPGPRVLLAMEPLAGGSPARGRFVQPCEWPCALPGPRFPPTPAPPWAGRALPLSAAPSAALCSISPGSFASFQGVPPAPGSPGLNKPGCGCPMSCPDTENGRGISSWQRGRGARPGSCHPSVPRLAYPSSPDGD